jgi:hypothetical protein
MNTLTPESPRRRTGLRIIAALGLGALTAALTVPLAGCGGGGSDGGSASDTPRIDSFQADRSQYFVGDSARLSVRFVGGSGRIEPGIGAVTSGVAIDTPALDATRRYRLVVTRAGQPTAEREITLPVVYRERMQPIVAFNVSLHAAVATADGGALVLGGSRGEGVLSSAIDRFNPASRAFTRIGQMATGRARASAIALGNGQVLVFGGDTSANEAPFAELIDERTGASTRAGTLRQPRIRHAAVRLADGRVLALGGQGRSSAEIWDPATRSWRLLGATMAHSREFASATLLDNGQVLVVGGDTAATNYVFAEIFDPASERFTPVAGAPAERRWLHAAHRQADGTVLIGAGERFDGQRIDALATTWRVSADGQQFSPAAAWSTGRTLQASVLTRNGDWLLFGGQTIGDGNSDAAVARQPTRERTWPALPGGRIFHSATLLACGRVLVVGGEDIYGSFVPTAALYD